MDKKENKPLWVKVRIHEAERAYWHSKAKASGRTLSDLIREALGRVRQWSPVDKSAERARLRELTRIGINLNQIAKWANGHKAQAEAAEVIAQLINIQRAISVLDHSFPTAQNRAEGDV